MQAVFEIMCVGIITHKECFKRKRGGRKKGCKLSLPPLSSKGDTKRMKEVWKQIRNFPFYQISNLGRIKSFKRSFPRILNPPKVWNGYFRVNLCNSATDRSSRAVHNLVLEAFVGHRPDGYECNHKDGIKTNNCINNLEWVSHGENERHAYKLGLKRSPWEVRGERHPRTKLKDGEVWLIKRLLWFEYPQRKIAKMFHVTHGAVSSISRGFSWQQLLFEPTQGDREVYKRYHKA